MLAVHRPSEGSFVKKESLSTLRLAAVQFQRNILISWSGKTIVRQLRFTTEVYILPTSRFLDTVVQNTLCVPIERLRFRINGVDVVIKSVLSDYIKNEDTDIYISISCKLLGGKGGFGAQLRGQRGSRKRVKNYDACRDLSGRRVRHVQTADRLAAWQEKKKKEDELVEALGGPDIVELKKKPETKLSGRGPSLQVIGQRYLEGLEVTQNKMLAALEKSVLVMTQSSATEEQQSHSSSSIIQPKAAKSYALTQRFLGDFPEESSSDDEEQSCCPSHFAVS